MAFRSEGALGQSVASQHFINIMYFHFGNHFALRQLKSALYLRRHSSELQRTIRCYLISVHFKSAKSCARVYSGDSTVMQREEISPFPFSAS